MTRKEALKYAIILICEKEDDSYIKESAIEKLKICIEDLPISHWTRDSILDACEQYMIDNKRGYLTAADFKCNNMPNNSALIREFGVPAGEFARQYYSNPNPKVSRKQTDNDIIKEFIKNFKNINPESAFVYNSQRPSGSLGWETCAKITGTRGWMPLLKTLGLEYSASKNYRVKSNYESIANMKDIEV